MRGWVLVLVLVLACGSKDQSGPDEGSASPEPPKPAPATIDAAVAVADAAVTIDAAVAVVDAAPPEPPPPATKAGVEFVAFEGLKEDKLGNIDKIWTAWIKDHFEKCESDEQVDEVTTTATIVFGDEIKFDLPKVPPKLAACIEKKIRTPYLGYEPTPPPAVGNKLRVKVTIAVKGPPEPPDTSPVKYLASKVKGARPKQELTKWLDKQVARKLKPCIEDTAVVQDLWKIGFEIDRRGAMKNVTAPGDANVATCVQKVLDGLEAPAGPGTNTVELVYTRPN